MDADPVFKALADPARRALLDRLHAKGGLSLVQLCAGQPMTRQAVSKHLVVLERANLVVSERRGRTKLHHLNPVPIQQLADRWIGKFQRAPLRALTDLKRTLEAGHDAAATDPPPQANPED